MPEDRDKSETKSDRPAQRKKPILSIRARLIVLALLAIAPLMFERVHALESARAKRTADAHTQVIELARQDRLPVVAPWLGLRPIDYADQPLEPRVPSALREYRGRPRLL